MDIESGNQDDTQIIDNHDGQDESIDSFDYEGDEGADAGDQAQDVHDDGDGDSAPSVEDRLEQMARDHEQFQTAVVERLATSDAEKRQLMALLQQQRGGQDAQTQRQAADPFEGLDDEERKRLEVYREQILSPVQQELQGFQSKFQNMEREAAYSRFRERWAERKDHPFERIHPHVEKLYDKMMNSPLDQQLDILGYALSSMAKEMDAQSEHQKQGRRALNKKARSGNADALSRSSSPGRQAEKVDEGSRNTDPIKEFMQAQAETPGTWLNQAGGG